MHEFETVEDDSITALGMVDMEDSISTRGK